MALTHKAKKRWSLAILLVGLPLYIVASVTIINFLYPDPTTRPPLWIELSSYIGLGILWAFPFRFMFKGVGQADPDA